MKNIWKTLVLVAGTAGIGYYALKVDKAPESEEDAKRPQLFDFKADSFNGISVIREKGRLSLERKDDLSPWQMTEPKSVPANPDEVRTLFSAFENFRAERALDIPATEWSSYGLEPAKLSVEARGATPAVFKAGDKDPSDSFRYVLKDNKVYLVSSYLFERFEKDADEYRARDLIAFDRTLVEKIRYQGRGKRVSLEKDGEAWKLLEPAKAWKISESAVDGLLTQVLNLKVRTFVDDNPKSSVPYGFKAGDQEVLLKAKGGAEYRVAFGSLKSGNKEEVYIKTGAGPAVHTTTATWPENIFKDPSDLRDKAIFDFSGGDLSEFSVAGAKTALRAQRTGPPESEGGAKTWVSVEPAGNTQAAAKIREAADELGWLRVMDFLAGKQPSLTKAGLEKPAFEARFRGMKSDKEISGWIRLGAATPEGSTVYATASGVEGVFTLPGTLKVICEGLAEPLNPAPQGASVTEKQTPAP